jgi:hypothetical protein
MPRKPLYKLTFALILSSLVLLLLLGCAPCCVCPYLGGTGGDGNTTTGSVSGTCFITNNSGKTAVPGISVTVGSSKTETDNSGHFLISGLAPGTYEIGVAGGDLGYSGQVTVVAGQTTNLGELQLHGTLPPPPPKTGGTTKSTAYPTTAEGVITAYYAAINAQDYASALSFLAEQMGGQNMNSIKASYEPYVKNIQVAKIQRTPSMDFNSRSIYVVTFTVDYIQH